MSRRVLTVDRFKEIERLLAAGRGAREITRALKCSRRLVREIRDGLHGPPDQPRSTADPPWMAQVNWPEIVHDLGLGHPASASKSITPAIRSSGWSFPSARSARPSCLSPVSASASCSSRGRLRIPRAPTGSGVTAGCSHSADFGFVEHWHRKSGVSGC